MEKYRPSISMFFDKRVEKKSGKYPLKLSVYCKPYKKRYNTNIDLTPEEWKKVNSENLRDENLKKIRFSINALTNKAEKIIESLTPFSFHKFENSFYEN
ncbi:MAG: Arm DNA-binding domain-containing protein, partial [Ferruginibacter sp.]